ncbi:hypothetical protein BDR26DRAFT_851683 [Obelidium mucronatum]|nr:hypothetical protein BDR26DRAFT_851683 [Obelidium mucronatum]
MFAELRHIAATRLVALAAGGAATPTASHGVFVADAAAAPAAAHGLATHAAALEAAALAKHRWHAGSDGKVLDLIHPSDYCLVHGRSLLRDSSKHLIGVKKSEVDLETSARDVSRKFQWLPAEFKVDAAGAVTIESYINNLNRRESPELYKDVAAAFQLMLSTDPTNRIEASMDNNDYQQDQYEWQIDQFLIRKYGKDVNLKNQALREAAQASDEYDEFQDEIWDQTQDRPVHVPGLPKEFVPPADTKVHTMNLRGRNVQVIVKMANIHLTPEKPSFSGAIAATGILYYAMDNITPSRLTFRSVYDSDDGMAFMYEQSDFAGLEKVFGFTNEVSNNVQICGQIEARQNRCVVFPNFLHHRVEDFELVDKTRSGHRKILAFFVIHPDIRVTSTRDVGMQQEDWVVEEFFPIEIVRQIVGFTGGVMTEKEAAQFANEVMEERKNTPVDGYANIQNIFLCEH